MSEHQNTAFDETLLSGYLDGELTQADAQRVRLRLEEDPEARALVAELREIRDAARSTRLPAPPDETWDERPRSAGSGFLRRTGWLVLIVWAAALAGIAAWGLATGPEAWWEKTLAAGIVAGPVLLLSSVLLDRLQVMKHDRYRRVKK